MGTTRSWFTRRNAIAITGGALVLYLAFTALSILLYYTNVSVIAKNDPIHFLSPKLATTKSHVEDSAYVFLALGAQANSMTCGGAVESLVRYGGWSGDVYLITDRPNCFNRAEIVANAQMEDGRLHIMPVDGEFSSGGYDSADEVQFRKARLLSLTMKTHIFDIIPNVEVLAFIDCDIIVGVEGCPASFIRDGPQFPEYSVKFSRMYYADQTGHVTLGRTQEDQVKAGNTFVDVHSGTFVAHRKHSAELIRLWRAEMETFEHDGDHNSFMAAYHKQEELHKAAVAAGGEAEWVHPMRPGELKYFAEPHSGATMYEKFFEGDKMSVNCFNHISKARCSKYGRTTIQKFAELFKLRTYMVDSTDPESLFYPYCTHPMVQPLLYGWFPVKYIPFCPKFERVG